MIKCEIFLDFVKFTYSIFKVRWFYDYLSLDEWIYNAIILELTILIEVVCICSDNEYSMRLEIY